jgi:hypothetical protein
LGSPVQLCPLHCIPSTQRAHANLLCGSNTKLPSLDTIRPGACDGLAAWAQCMATRHSHEATVRRYGLRWYGNLRIFWFKLHINTLQTPGSLVEKIPPSRPRTTIARAFFTPIGQTEFALIFAAACAGILCARSGFCLIQASLHAVYTPGIPPSQLATSQQYLIIWKVSVPA